MWVGMQERLFGFIILSDTPNPSTSETIQQLDESKIRTTLLSGDNPKTTRAIAEKVGISDYVGSLLPEEKAGRISSWQENSEYVMMVGDGVNDARLAQAKSAWRWPGELTLQGKLRRHPTNADLTLIPWLVSYPSERVGSSLKTWVGHLPTTWWPCLWLPSVLSVR